MTLEQFRSYHRLTYQQLADLIGLSGNDARRTVHRYATGQRFPSPQMLRRIRLATRAAVTAEDFVAQHTTAHTTNHVTAHVTAHLTALGA